MIFAKHFCIFCVITYNTKNHTRKRFLSQNDTKRKISQPSTEQKKQKQMIFDTMQMMTV